eukprot:3838399-Pleurochrysis_carterae.AAC.1
MPRIACMAYLYPSAARRPSWLSSLGLLFSAQPACFLVYPRYDPYKYQRGLVIDKKRGNLLKLDRHKYVKARNRPRCGLKLSFTEKRRIERTGWPDKSCGRFSTSILLCFVKNVG